MIYEIKKLWKFCSEIEQIITKIIVTQKNKFCNTKIQIKERNAMENASKALTMAGRSINWNISGKFYDICPTKSWYDE